MFNFRSIFNFQYQISKQIYLNSKSQILNIWDLESCPEPSWVLGNPEPFSGSGLDFV